VCDTAEVTVEQPAVDVTSVLPESEIRLELKFTGDRSSILGIRPILLPPENCAPNMTKMQQKLLKEIARRLHYFFPAQFRKYSLKIFEGGGLGAWPPIAP